ncbi:MAG: hypothetical protein J1E16_04410 [Muribaculaceae bacterium]|nr:hypothetical protein [Muribaculaceae bacterium]
MKKWIIAIILVLIAQSLWADEWLKAYSDDEVTIFVYNEYKTSSDGYKIWTEWCFNSSKKVGEYSYKSYKDYSEYSKDFDRLRDLSTTYYDEKGKVVETYTPSYSNWSYIVPGSIGNAVADFIIDMINYNL